MPGALPAFPGEAVAPKSRPLPPPRLPGAEDADTEHGTMSPTRFPGSGTVSPQGSMPPTRGGSRSPPRMPGSTTPPLQTMAQPRFPGAVAEQEPEITMKPQQQIRGASPPRFSGGAAASLAAAASSEYAGLASSLEIQPKLKAARISAKPMPAPPLIRQASDAVLARLDRNVQPPPPPPLAVRPLRQLTDAEAAQQPGAKPMKIKAVQRPPPAGEQQQPPPLPGRGQPAPP